ncbi:MAG: efflux RND transporter periplasmic adaptor subunit [Proteobacteria bacterium]|nr:efflux RND transporter periplasmic adaptor subunit [Pseudomonadota bacterium]
MAEDGRESRLPDLSALRIDPQARLKARRGKRTGLIVAVVAAIAVLGVSALALKNRKVTVEVAAARAAIQGKGAVVLNASGYVTPRRRATVAAKITGRVQELLVEEGMHVEAGQVLARLDDSDAKSRVASARTNQEVAFAAIAELEVNLTDANRTLYRTEKLFREGVSSQQDFDHAQAEADALKARIALTKEQVRYAKAQLEVALRDLDNCTVRSPFKGIVVSKDAQIGEMVSPVSAGGGFTRTGIATIVDMNSLEIEVDVNESYIAKVSTGQKVEATLDAYPDWQIPCTVRTVIPTADRQKATIKVRIAFDALDPRILPDMGVKVSFLNSEETSKNTGAHTLIPRQAVRDVDGKQVAFQFKEGKLTMRPVKLGQTRGNEIEVLEGIAAGDQVVVNGPEKLRDRQRAEVKR